MCSWVQFMHAWLWWEFSNGSAAYYLKLFANIQTKDEVDLKTSNSLIPQHWLEKPFFRSQQSRHPQSNIGVARTGHCSTSADGTLARLFSFLDHISWFNISKTHTSELLAKLWGGTVPSSLLKDVYNIFWRKRSLHTKKGGLGRGIYRHFSICFSLYSTQEQYFPTYITAVTTVVWMHTKANEGISNRENP